KSDSSGGHHPVPPWEPLPPRRWGSPDPSLGPHHRAPRQPPRPVRPPPGAAPPFGRSCRHPCGPPHRPQRHTRYHTHHRPHPPPAASAGPHQTVVVGATVTLDGSASSDVDGDPLTFRWALTVVPTGSTTTLTNATTVHPTFVVDQAGTYVAQLIVNDGTLDSLPATVTITTTQNSRPGANAGPAQTVVVGTTVTLDGSASSDVDSAEERRGWRWSTGTG